MWQWSVGRAGGCGGGEMGVILVPLPWSAWCETITKLLRVRWHYLINNVCKLLYNKTTDISSKKYNLHVQVNKTICKNASILLTGWFSVTTCSITITYPLGLTLQAVRLKGNDKVPCNNTDTTYEGESADGEVGWTHTKNVLIAFPIHYCELAKTMVHVWLQST